MEEKFGFYLFFKLLLELQNRGLGYIENMNLDKKKMFCKVLFVSCSGDVSDSCEKGISMTVSFSHLWNKSTDSVECRGENKCFGNYFILAAYGEGWNKYQKICLSRVTKLHL